jgi:hypothetical protein
MFLKMKSTQLSHKTFFFLSFYIGFIIYLEVTQGHFYNLHILNIIKKNASVCGWPNVVWAVHARLFDH